MMSEHDSVVDEIVAGGSKCSRAHDSASSNAFGLFQIARVKPLSEPPVSRSQQFARLLHLALVATEAGGNRG